MTSERRMKPLPVLVATTSALLIMLALLGVGREFWLGTGDTSPDRIATVYSLDPRHPEWWSHGARLSDVQKPRPGYASIGVYELSDGTLFVQKGPDGKWHATDTLPF